MSWPVTLDTKPKTPAAVEIFFQLDCMDLPTRFLTLGFLRLVTVLVLVPLRLANEYYNKVRYLCLEFRIKSVMVFIQMDLILYLISY